MDSRSQRKDRLRTARTALVRLRPSTTAGTTREKSKHLIRAVKTGDLCQATSLVSSGYSVIETDDMNRTVLMLCAALSNEEKAAALARTLLTERTSSLPAAVDILGLNALHYSCANGRAKLTTVLLRSHCCCIKVKCGLYGNTALHYAVTSGSVDTVAVLIDYLRKYGYLLNEKNKDGYTPAMLARQLGYQDIEQQLLEIRQSETLQVNTKTCGRYHDEETNFSRLPQHGSWDYHNSKQRGRQAVISHVGEQDTFLPLLSDDNDNRQGSSGTWRDMLQLLWAKYQQQVTVSYRKSAKLPSKTPSDTQDASGSMIEDTTNTNGQITPNKHSLNRRRFTTFGALQKPVRRQSALTQSQQGLLSNRMETLKYRRQSVAV